MRTVTLAPFCRSIRHYRSSTSDLDDAAGARPMEWRIHSYLPIKQMSGAPPVLSLRHSISCANERLMNTGIDLCDGAETPSLLPVVFVVFVGKPVTTSNTAGAAA